MAKEEDRQRSLKACIKATEEKVLQFIGQINSMLDQHEEFFDGNDQFKQIWSELINNKHFSN